MFFIYFLLTNFITPELKNIKSELINHNTVKIYKSNNKALKYQRDGVKNYLSPIVSLGINNMPYNFSYQDSAMTGNLFSISQNLIWSDKLDKKKDIINSMISENKTKENYFIEENFIMISKKYYKIFFLNKKLGQIKEKKQVYKDLLDYLNNIKTYKKVSETKIVLLKFKIEKIDLLLEDIKTIKIGLISQIKNLSEINQEKMIFTFKDINQNIETWQIENKIPKTKVSIKEHLVKNKINILKSEYKYFKTLNKPDFKFTFAWLQRFEQKMSNGSDLFSFNVSMSLPFWDNSGTYEAHKSLELVNAAELNLNKIKYIINSDSVKNKKIFESNQKSLKICKNTLKPIIESLNELNNDNLSYDNSDFTDIIELKELMINTSIECTDLSIKAIDSYFNYLFTRI
jgi:hypothetical protein